jgi:hypothetical protein
MIERLLSPVYLNFSLTSEIRICKFLHRFFLFTLYEQSRYNQNNFYILISNLANFLVKNNYKYNNNKLNYVNSHKLNLLR